VYLKVLLRHTHFQKFIDETVDCVDHGAIKLLAKHFLLYHELINFANIYCLRNISTHYRVFALVQ